jgi:hypothetical protein
MEEKHAFEVRVLEHFLQLYEKLSAGEVVKGESPDFVIKIDGKQTGVEISKVLNRKAIGEAYTPAQKHALETKIVDNARDKFLSRNNIPLHVYFHFEENLAILSNQVENLAENICCVVENEVRNQDFTSYFTFAIEYPTSNELRSISGLFSPKVSASVWYPAKAMAIPNLTSKQLKETILKKEIKVKQYRKKADTLILVLAEGMLPESWFDSIEYQDAKGLSSGFDKIFLVRMLANELIELK